jgi:hypothetical protein
MPGKFPPCEWQILELLVFVHAREFDLCDWQILFRDKKTRRNKILWKKNLPLHSPLVHGKGSAAAAAPSTVISTGPVIG